MTIASDRGFVVGRSYKVKERSFRYCSSTVEGDYLFFTKDDDTDVPKFQRIDGEETFFPLDNLVQDALPISKVTFEDRPVSITTTVICAGRKLTQDEKDAIERIINQGV